MNDIMAPEDGEHNLQNMFSKNVLIKSFQTSDVELAGRFFFNVSREHDIV